MPGSEVMSRNAPFRSLRAWLRHLHRDGRLAVLREGVALEHELAAVAKRLDADLAIIDKRREKAGVSEVMNIIGSPEGRRCILVDDIVDSAGTLCNAAQALMDAGARSVSLQTPLDLSSFDGLALTCGFESDAEPERRTWKATVRTQNDRGEMVYQATFTPPVVVDGNGSEGLSVEQGTEIDNG